MPPKRKPCFVCGESRDVDDAGELRRTFCAELVPVCPTHAEGPAVRWWMLLRIVREQTRTNTRGLSAMKDKVLDAWSWDSAPPGSKACKGAALFLALVGDREAWTLDGVRGGQAVVVSRLDRGEVVRFRRKVLGRKGRVRSWGTRWTRLLSLFRGNAPLDLQVELDKRLAHGAVDVETGSERMTYMESIKEGDSEGGS